jgi:hypothetical protein
MPAPSANETMADADEGKTSDGKVRPRATSRGDVVALEMEVLRMRVEHI